MAGILRSVRVTFSAITGPFVGPITAAGGAVRGFGRSIESSLRPITQVGSRIDALGRDIQTMQRRISDAPRSMSQSQRAAMRDQLRGMQDQRAALVRQQQSFQRLGQTAQVAGIAMVAGFAFAVKAAAEFDKSMSKVAAVMDTTGLSVDEVNKQMQALRKAAIDAGRDTQYSARQAADAEAELAKAGIGTSDILNGALKGSLSLAAAGQLDLADAATVSAQAMNIFSLKGGQVGHIADVLAAGANKSAADVKGLAWSLKMGGQVAAQTGLTLEDTVGVLSAFADQALIGSDAGTSMKTMLQHLANPTNKTSELMADLGFEVYDASGNFVGMSQVAANLQKSLGKLTQEQRNQAMAQIFGSDAVRGANVLYKIGAAGVDEYTRAVNDNGAAARTAAKLMDNLSGDVEQLKGSLETALITSGSGANNVLRDMVQVVTGAINAYSALPASVQSGTMMIIGMAGAAVLVTKAGAVMVRTVGDIRVALGALNISGRAVGPTMMAIRTALVRTAAFMTGPLGIAIVTGIALWQAWSATKKKAAEASDAFVEAIRADSGSLGENTRAAVANMLSETKVSNSRKESALVIANTAGITMPRLTDAILGNKDAYDSVIQSINTYAGSLEAKAKAGTISREDMAKELEGLMFLKSTLEGQTGSMKASVTEARLKTEATKADTAATGDLAAATQHVEEAVQDHDTAEKALVETMRSSATTAKDLSQAFDNLAKANMAVDEANIKARESTKETIKVNDKKKGVNDKELQSLIDLTRNYQNVLVAEKANGTYGEELFKIQDKLAGQFIKAALAKGADASYARKLAREYGLLVDHSVASADALDSWIDKANGAAGSARHLAQMTGGNAKDAANAFRASIERSLPVLYAMAGSNQKLRGQINTLASSLGIATGKTNVSKKAFMQAADAMHIGSREAAALWTKLQKLQKLDGKSIDIDVNAKGEWELGGKPKTRRSSFATGGRVPYTGDGASRSFDSVDARLRVDEHVLTPEEVDAMGGHSAVYRMRKAALRGEVVGFAAGGRVGRANLTHPGSGATIAQPIILGYQDMIAMMMDKMGELIASAMSGGGVVQAARAMIGLPYAWGGGGPGGPSYGIDYGSNTFGFDCSGLTEYAWWKGRHVEIGGVTGTQMSGSHAIGSPREGALGFPHPGHVVLYSGNGNVIQAPHTGAFVNEGPISRSYAWRWPNNAGFATGGRVTRAEEETGERFVNAGHLTEDLYYAKAYGLAGDPGRIKGYAGGGQITGRPGVDQLLLRGTAGEFMVNSSATRRYGPWLDMINSGMGDALLRRSVGMSGGRSGGGGSVTLVLNNYGVLGSQRDVDTWLTKSMERLRRENRLPSANR